VNQLKEQVSNCGLNGCVIWHGYLHNKADIYSKVDFCIVPSVLPESFGLTAVEPAIYGRPVIASSIGGLAEIIDHGKTGFLFAPGNVSELRDHIKYCMENPDIIAALGKHAQEEYSKRFSEKTLHEQVEKLLMNLAGGNN